MFKKKSVEEPKVDGLDSAIEQLKEKIQRKIAAGEYDGELKILEQHVKELTSTRSKEIALAINKEDRERKFKRVPKGDKIKIVTSAALSIGMFTLTRLLGEASPRKADSIDKFFNKWNLLK